MNFTRIFFQAISHTYDVTLLVGFIYTFFCYKKLDKASRFICMLIWLGVIAETIARFTALKFGNNMPVYTVSSTCEFVIICLYYNNSLKFYKKWYLGIIMAVAGIIFSIVNTAVFQPLHTINSNFLFFECMGIVSLSLFSIYQRLMTTDLRLSIETHFWIPCILLFFQCATLWSWGIYNYIATRHIEKSIFLNISILLVNVLTYVSLILILFLYPKMRRTYV